MKLIPTRFASAYLIETDVHGDHRGFFTESYNERSFRENNLLFDFVQDNHSLSVDPGVIRGLHYQLNPKAQTKLIRVIAGAIYDVIVDIRRHSPTFGQWQSFELNETNKRQLLVPRGFAHGFCTLLPNTQVIYKVDEYYSPEHDRGIAWNDPALGIDWPVSNPILSGKDESHPHLGEAEMNFDEEVTL